MVLSSMHYLIFLLITVLLYYCLPAKIRWIALLFGNAYFLYQANSVKELLVWAVTALFTFFCALISSFLGQPFKKITTGFGVFVVAFLLILLQDSSFFHLPSLQISPIGISYYSLTWIAYLLDCYWGTGTVQKNPLKFLSMAGFFPLMTSGPIISYKEVGENITGQTRFSYENLKNGSVRIAWGFLKKMIIADRIAVFVDTVYGNPYRYPGFFFLLANAFFVIQLYADFSGCIDIALGSAEVFGIKLPENFDLPFLSQTLEEFWRRWHITLGGWLRDFILYPILKSSPWQFFGKKSKKLFGKKIGKKLPVWLGLLISWFLVGFWHGGGWNYIFGVGILFGAIIILGDALSPLFQWLTKLLRINTDTFSWKVFRVVRTWLFFGTGLSFFRAHSLMDGFRNIKLMLSVYNPWIFFTGELYELGLDRTDFNILLFFLVIVILCGLLRHFTGKSVRQWLDGQNLLFRYILYALMVYSIIIYGCYGMGFQSASFIYQGF